MKIALITIHNSTNYGAVLQAYATKKVLSNYGIVNTIDYTNEHLKKRVKLFRFLPSVHGLKMLAHDILRLPYRLKVLLVFRKFIQSKMNLTPKLSSNNLINNKLSDYNIYVCGSDQIWNPAIISDTNEIDPIFFLSVVSKGIKKFSYASSIGHHNYTESEKIVVKDLLEDFTMISTRGSDGVKKLLDIFPNRKIHHVVDPTLLLSKKDWLTTFDIQLKEPKEKYILVYSVPRSQLLRDAIAFYAKKLNLKVIAIDKVLISMPKVDKQIRAAGPKEFIELFANASFIITDSFHGTCFAVNFKKPFVSISVGNIENRAFSLLSALGISERLVRDEKGFNSQLLEVDYKSVTTRLEKLRKESLHFIDKAISKN